MKQFFYLFYLILPVLSCATGEQTYLRTENGIACLMGNDSVVVSVISENVVRVERYALPYQKKIEQVRFVLPVNDSVDWKVKETRAGIDILTGRLKVTVEKSGTVSFRDKNGTLLTSALKPDGTEVKQVFLCGDEALYGMGQFQNGLLNLKNVPLRLKQFNQEIANPFLISTKGYGILWNNTSITDFNLPENKLEFTQLTDSAKNSRKTIFVPEQSGEYCFAVSSPNEIEKNRFEGPVLLTFNNDTVIHYNTTWVPEFHSGRIFLEKGKTYEVVFTNTNAPVPGEVLYNLPSRDRTVFQSRFGNAVDYFFVSGPPSEVIAGYRKLTGTAPLFARWAYGFWQCRERYHSQQELIENAREYRTRGIPVDNMVQDWNYWPDYTWGPEWDRTRYPDPEKMCRDLKEMNLQLMISVWPRIDNRKLEERYNLSKIDKEGNIDFFNPEMGHNYYRMLKDSMFDMGVNSIWLDGTEPELQPAGRMTAMGLFDHNALIYSWLVTSAVYEGHRNDFPDQRVFNLTRSGFAGQQRFGAAVWSGDVLASWEQFREQITAGLNLSMSGLPYWTTDIGGFFRDKNSLNPQYDNQYTNPEFKELLTRWFQFGTFCPLFRIHGYVSDTEIWRYGPSFEQTARDFIDIRYQLTPYIYSVAAEVTNEGAAVIKPLAHDYPNDRECRDIRDQFLFGQAFMICPVVKHGERQRMVYLPEGRWFDFWTGQALQGGVHIQAEASLERIPVYVKAGTVLPVGPKVQDAMQQSSDPLKLFIYPGADGEFTLYEDEGENYNYENGRYSEIRLKWDNAQKCLTIDNRKGDFNGMIPDREFELIVVRKGIGRLESKDARPVAYKGQRIQIQF